jgi:hypothetical protein
VAGQATGIEVEVYSLETLRGCGATGAIAAEVEMDCVDEPGPSCVGRFEDTPDFGSALDAIGADADVPTRIPRDMTFVATANQDGEPVDGGEPQAIWRRGDAGHRPTVPVVATFDGIPVDLPAIGIAMDMGGRADARGKQDDRHGDKGGARAEARGQCFQNGLHVQTEEATRS